ncbi:uncharacterized protein LOC128222931 [Mya arenaria]|uniref:uncharacterized protein LOC128222931 n=1 Tax=Mya arenaria TaxID=6604 RepID=UPI0022E25453|nr:uncharacterized protein LOC128222931 [Mya arenaria]
MFVYILLTFACVHAQITLPSHHQLVELVDQGIKLLDANHDGIIQMSEMERGWQYEDLNNDTMVSIDEYIKTFHLDPAVAQKYFDVYDTDKDGLLPHNFLFQFMHLVDKNHDGQVTDTEYLHYSISLAECLFGHGTHGHSANCDH